MLVGAAVLFVAILAIARLRLSRHDWLGIVMTAIATGGGSLFARALIELIKRRAYRALATGVAIIAAMAASPLLFYFWWASRAGSACRHAYSTRGLREREEAIARAEAAWSWGEAIFDKRSIMWGCSRGKRELEELESEQRCPFFLLPGHPCTCGEEPWGGVAESCNGRLVCGKWLSGWEPETVRCAPPEEVRRLVDPTFWEAL